MKKEVIILPNPISYLDHISRTIMDSFERDRPVSAEVTPITEVARMMVQEQGLLIITETK